jgi:hypothetical protein
MIPTAATIGRRAQTFTGILSLGAICVVFAGFARTYYLNPFFAHRALTWLLHVHGAICSAWFLVFLVQIVLVAIGRTDLHRRLGVWAFALACIVVLLGLVVAIHAAKLGSFASPSGVSPLAFLAIPFFDVVVFGTLTAAGLLYRRQPQIHKRLMVLSTLSILTPAVVRIPLDFVQSRGVIAAFALADLFAFIYIAYDTIAHKRLHAACVCAGLLIALSAPLRIAFASTSQWLAFAQWLTQ